MMNVCVVCGGSRPEWDYETVTVGGEPFTVCAGCASQYDGPGRGEAVPEDDWALAAVLEHLAGISMEDHFLSDESGYAGQFGEHILITDSQGFLEVRSFRDADAATLEMNSYEDGGMGAQEDDAYISYERNGLYVSFAGKTVGTFETLSRAKAAVSVQMRRDGYFPNVWLCGEHGPTIRRIDVW